MCCGVNPAPVWLSGHWLLHAAPFGHRHCCYSSSHTHLRCCSTEALLQQTETETYWTPLHSHSKSLLMLLNIPAERSQGIEWDSWAWRLLHPQCVTLLLMFTHSDSSIATRHSKALRSSPDFLSYWRVTSSPYTVSSTTTVSSPAPQTHNNMRETNTNMYISDKHIHLDIVFGLWTYCAHCVMKLINKLEFYLHFWFCFI